VRVIVLPLEDPCLRGSCAAPLRKSSGIAFRPCIPASALPGGAHRGTTRPSRARASGVEPVWRRLPSRRGGRAARSAASRRSRRLWRTSDLGAETVCSIGVGASASRANQSAMRVLADVLLRNPGKPHLLPREAPAIHSILPSLLRMDPSWDSDD
jgi:hypothetical protein